MKNDSSVCLGQVVHTADLMMDSITVIISYLCDNGELSHSSFTL